MVNSREFYLIMLLVTLAMIYVDVGFNFITMKYKRKIIKTAKAFKEAITFKSFRERRSSSMMSTSSLDEKEKNFKNRKFD